MEDFIYQCEDFDQKAFKDSMPCYYTDIHTSEIFKVGQMQELTNSEIAANWEEVMKAIDKELKSWSAHNACKAIHKRDCSVKAMSSRWVLQWKELMMEDGTVIRTVKARLVDRLAELEIAAVDRVPLPTAQA